MKLSKKIVTVLVGATMLVGLGAGSSLAAISCLDTKIVGVGYYPGQADIPNGKSGYRVRLECLDAIPSFTPAKSFYLSTDQGESGYATVLTAYSLGDHLNVYLGGPAANSLVFNIYVVPTP